MCTCGDDHDVVLSGQHIYAGGTDQLTVTRRDVLRGGVAAAVAARWSDEEMHERFRRAFVDANPLSDYTLPFVSMFSGRRVTRLLRAAFGEKDIEDLILPFYCVTGNLTTSTADIHTNGRLWRWLRASVSLPGVLPPFNDAGNVHVDGGVIDNFPVRPMRRLGRGTTIGIDIDTGGALSAGAGAGAWGGRRRLGSGRHWKQQQGGVRQGTRQELAKSHVVSVRPSGR